MSKSLIDTLKPPPEPLGLSLSSRIALAVVVANAVLLGVFMRLTDHPPLTSPIDDERMLFLNQYGTLQCHVRRVHRPSSEDEIVRIVQHASRMRRRLHVLGGGNSLSQIVCAQDDDLDALLSLERYDRIVRVDEEARLVTVEAGVQVFDLHEHLAEHGLALPTVPLVAEATVGGLLGTGSHVSGRNAQSVASLVTEMTVINSKGRVQTLRNTLKKRRAAGAGDGSDKGELQGNEEDEEEEEGEGEEEERLFRAAGVGLGVMGVISTVTLRCEPARNLLRVDTVEPLDAVTDSLEAVAGSSEFVQAVWVPYTESVVVSRWERTDNLPTRGTMRAVSEGWWALKRRMRNLCFVLSAWLPGLGSTLNSLSPSTARAPYTDPAYLTLTPEDLSRQTLLIELYVAIDKAGAAFRAIQEFVAKSDVTFNAPVRVRFGGEDPFLLSPLFERASSAAFQVALTWQSAATCDRVASALFQKLASMSVRVHWGRTVPGAVDRTHLKLVYRAYDTFRDKRYDTDSEGTFLNAFLLPITRHSSNDLSMRSDKRMQEEMEKQAAEETEKQAVKEQEERGKQTTLSKREKRREAASKRREAEEQEKKAREAVEFQKEQMRKRLEENEKNLQKQKQKAAEKRRKAELDETKQKRSAERAQKDKRKDKEAEEKRQEVQKQQEEASKAKVRARHEERREKNAERDRQEQHEKLAAQTQEKFEKQQARVKQRHDQDHPHRQRRPPPEQGKRRDAGQAEKQKKEEEERAKKRRPPPQQQPPPQPRHRRRDDTAQEQRAKRARQAARAARPKQK